MIKFKWTELGWVVQPNKWLLVVVNMDFPAHGLCHDLKQNISCSVLLLCQ